MIRKSISQIRLNKSNTINTDNYTSLQNTILSHTLNSCTSQNQQNIYKKHLSQVHSSPNQSPTRLQKNNSLSKSVYRISWSRFIHRLPRQYSVGKQPKPLVVYDQRHKRNKMPVIFKNDKEKSKKKNTFQNFDLIKNSMELKSIMQTTYHKSFKHPLVLKKQCLIKRRSLNL